ncbi:MAG: sugar ABC transporter ATP-binding protein [Chloroflexi bacterium]|nr:MAG: sugar ABC transporter ATP-binding protein [Chloroflexota bacterium]MBL1196476.1 sugar ABC transporter ATP-binding protein [Chloroflexota bacterium]NOH13771.1 sugar ABC transporter ATP-binding protein [Chloroflexota bacterium]
MMEVRNITKEFPGVKALDDVSVKFYPGEVHAVVGENGAGKSTLMKVMAGAYIADEGDVLLQGEKVQFPHPQVAQEQGVSIIYQELNLLPERTVAQNIFLGREPSRFGLVDSRALNEATLDVLERLDSEDTISPSAMLNTLSVAEQQIVEIAKAISFDSKVLIMDEPTAALSSNEVDILVRLVERLKARGIALIFISHRLKEVFDLADKITVLKDGQLVDTVNPKDVNTGDVIHMMVGRELNQFFPPLAEPGDIGDTVLSISDGANDFLKNINLELRAGEIVGVSGLQGSGRTELAEALFGAEPFKQGTLEINGLNTPVRSPAQAIKLNMGFVTEDRKSQGIFPNQSLRDNMLVTVRALQRLLAQVKRDGVRKNPDLVPTLGEQVDVRASGYDQEVQYLSGGNQQKVVLAKWLAPDTEVLIFDEPTRGIDVEAKASIHEMIRDLAKQGAAIMMVSSELPEIVGMSDRIIVMWDGTITGELPAKSSEAEIMVLATGYENGDKKDAELVMESKS